MVKPLITGLLQVAAWSIVLLSASHAAACIEPNSTVTMSGTIHIRTLSPDRDLGRARSSTYPVLTLDSPVCVLDRGFGSVPHGTETSVVFTPQAKRLLSNGQHVTLTGALSPPDNGSQPPEKLMLFVTSK